MRTRTRACMAFTIQGEYIQTLASSRETAKHEETLRYAFSEFRIGLLEKNTEYSFVRPLREMEGCFRRQAYVGHDLRGCSRLHGHT